MMFTSADIHSIIIEKKGDFFMFSIIVPAHNEEKYIGKCLSAIKDAEKYAGTKAQIIVSANRCTDKTIEISKKFGAEICVNNEKCISAVRNAGAELAKGEIIVTIDADSCMSETSLAEIKSMLESGKFIGGGAVAVFDRYSLGIVMSSIYVARHVIPIMIKEKSALTGGMFWCYKKDFDKIGGFNKEFISLEDMDFAVRLKNLGLESGKKYGTLKKSRIITSSRKFDEFGDWYLIKNRKLTKKIFTGKDREASDKFYYDVR